jgi:hypothetical protein
MILLSENQDYRYYAEEVPPTAENIRIEYEKLINKTYLYWRINWSNPTDWGVKEIPHNSEILGVIGKVPEITKNFQEVFPTIAQARRKMKELGILTENPIPKPEFNYDFPPDGPSDSMLASAEHDFEERSIQWQEHESKLVKAVIIKVKK